MRLHKKPIDNEPSKLFAKFAQEISANSNGLIVDVASGYGRNALHISSFGASVLCVDNSKDSLSYLELMQNRNISTLYLDLIKDPWPFPEESLGAIINVHFLPLNLVDSFLSSLKVGGFLFIETIDGHGENYLHLPPQGYIKSKLSDVFDIRYIKENKVGPPLSNASTLKVFAKKKASSAESVVS